MDVPAAPRLAQRLRGATRPRRRRLPRRADRHRRALSTSLPARHDGAGDHVDGAGWVARRRGRAPGRPLAPRARAFGDRTSAPRRTTTRHTCSSGRSAACTDRSSCRSSANPSSTTVARPLSGPSTGQGTARRPRLLRTPSCGSGSQPTCASASKAVARAHDSHCARASGPSRHSHGRSTRPPRPSPTPRSVWRRRRSSGANGSPPATSRTTRGESTCKGVH